MDPLEQFAGEGQLLPDLPQTDLETVGETFQGFTSESQQPLPSYTEADLAEQEANRVAADQEAADNKPPLMKAMGGAVISEWSPAWHMMTSTPEIDPDFKMTPELYRELTDDVPEEYHSWFDQIVSADHGRQLKDQMNLSMNIDRDLAQYGAWSIPMRLVAAAFDPVAVAATVATEGTLAPLVLARKASRVKRILTRGAIAGGTNAATEALLVSGKPTGSNTDIAIAGLAGFGLGSLAEAFKKGTPADIKKAFEGVAEVADKHSKSAGAMEAHAYDIPLREDSAQKIVDAEANAPGQETGLFSATRWDATGQNLRSPNPIVRELTAKLSPNPTGNIDGSKVAFTAAEDSGRIEGMYQTRFAKTVGKAANEYLREKGVTLGNRERAYNDFMESVGEAVENPDIDVHPLIRQAANDYNEMMEELYTLAHRPGEMDGNLELPSVKGFETYRPLKNYLTRVYDHLKIQELTDKFGTSGIQRLIRGSIESAMQKAGKAIDDLALDKLSYWHLKKLRSHAVGGNALEMRKLSGEDREGLRELLGDVEQGAGLSTEQIDDILDMLEKPQEGTINRAKHRLVLDHGFSMGLKSKDGAVEQVSINQLYKRNAGELFNSYTRQISGAIAMARKGYRTAGEFEAEIDRLAEHATALRERGIEYSESQLKRDQDNLRFMHDYIRGNTLYGVNPGTASGSGWRLANALLGYNYVRVMNQTGLAQIPELANIIGHVSLRTLANAIPSFRAITREAKAGKLSDEFMDSIEDYTGLGASVMRDVPTNRYDDFGTTLDPQEHKYLTRIEKLVDKGKRITSRISGMAQITDFSYRIAMPGEARNILESAMGLKTPNMKRLKADGLDAVMLGRIKTQAEKYAQYGEGEFTGKSKVTNLNWDDWDDLEAAYAMQTAIYRSSRRMVQATDAGDLNRLMAHPIGRVLLQFRSFVLVSWAKQLGYQVRMRDMEAAVSIMGQLLLGSMVYYAQSQIRSAGMSDKDRKEYLEEHLTTEKVVAASFQRTGTSSILPGIVDTLGNYAGFDPVFAGRTTGLATDFLTGSPTVDTWKRVEKGILEASGEAVFQEEDQWTQGEAKALLGLLPFSNAIGVINAVNLMTKDMPERD
jgi:hypothetical protein